MTTLACVTGRFQPVHRQHVELFAIAAASAEHLVVAVTNPDPGARRPEPTSTHRHRASANPFGYLDRARLLAAALAGAGLEGRATVVPFDLTRPQVWEHYVPLHARQFVRVHAAWERDKAARLGAAGYPVTVLDAEPGERLAATAVRAALAAGEPFEHLVPAATVPLLRRLTDKRLPTVR